ncbi:hypothetical protein K504DRAFT_252739 [Pleomassaria siparia CBS 279.74]|uniref:Uncharacterized protein n=1 Tax=Pleomassaria siparia CBS 279.74 TaxID=1314801 RepID=A0A6G1KBY6_9PLEO|nr:hypothetical protein K504DRAFT_252739 [Pleomassaria siparia CBS 279.74]
MEKVCTYSVHTVTWVGKYVQKVAQPGSWFPDVAPVATLTALSSRQRQSLLEEMQCNAVNFPQFHILACASGGQSLCHTCFAEERKKACSDSVLPGGAQHRGRYGTLLCLSNARPRSLSHTLALSHSRTLACWPVCRIKKTWPVLFNVSSHLSNQSALHKSSTATWTSHGPTFSMSCPCWR